MDSTTLAAFFGSAVGGLSGILPTLFVQHLSARKELMLKEAISRENLYAEFIKEASARYVDSLQGSLEDPTLLVPLFSLIGRIRLVGTSDVLRKAEEVGELIVRTYDEPAIEIKKNFAKAKLANPLLDFTEACRRERNLVARSMSSLNYFTVERNSCSAPIGLSPESKSGECKYSKSNSSKSNSRGSQCSEGSLVGGTSFSEGVR